MVASQYPSSLPSPSVLHHMTGKPIELSHLEGHLNSLIAPQGGEERGVRSLPEELWARIHRCILCGCLFHWKTRCMCKLSSPFSSVVIIVIYIFYLCNLNKPYMSYTSTGHQCLLIFILNFLKNFNNIRADPFCAPYDALKWR